MLMKRIFIILVSVLILSNTYVFSQITHGGYPTEWTQLKSASLSDEDLIVLPSFKQPSADAIYAEIKSSKYKALKFARSFNVQLNTQNSGNWHTLRNGQRVWTLSIQSANAKSINIIFSKYDVPEGGMVFVYNRDKSSVRGGFNHLNNKASGVLPIMPVLGDYITIEYQEPLFPAYDAELEIGTVNHDYIGVMGNYKLGYFGDAQECHINVACDEAFNSSSPAVVKMIVGGVELCSGALINNTARDGKPYVLSAAHCFKDAMGVANTTLFIFNYQCPFCSTPTIEGTREQSVAGGIMRAYSPGKDSADIDFALAELSVPVPDAYRPVYLGWDRRNVVPSKSYGIHHPVGDVKKLSVDNNSPSIRTLVVSGKHYFDKAHFEIFKWDLGSTEPGSSGSPLLNSNFQIIGALSAGLADCSSPRYDYYYRFNIAWDSYPEADKQLKVWLDPLNTNETMIESYRSEEVKKIGVLSNVSETDNVILSKLPGINEGYKAGHNSLEIKEYAEKFSSNETLNILGVYFVPYLGRRITTNRLKLKIWEGAAMPQNLVLEKDVLIQEWIRTQGVNPSNYGETGGYAIKPIYNDMQNYISLESEGLVLNSNFFVGFELQYPASSVDTFALYQTNPLVSQQTNTAYFYDGQNWSGFDNYPGMPSNSALWIDVLVKGSVGVNIDKYKYTTQNYSVFPNPGTQNNTHIRISDSVVSETRVQVYSTSGELVYSSKIPASLKKFTPNFSQLPSGIYNVLFINEHETEIIKLSLIKD